MITKQKGTYDVLPNEVFKWHIVEHKLRHVCDLYNFKEIRTPIFEASELFHRGIGSTSDIVTKETYDFTDRGGRMITLRPEGTAGVVRAYVENKLYANQNVTKLFYMGPIFRYERPQKGRFRQFSQFGVEALGSASPLIDAEVIAFSVTCLKALGLKGVKVKINSIGDDESRANYRNALVNHFSQYKECLCGDCLNRLENNPLRILDCKVDGDKDFFKGAPKIKDYLNEASKNHFNKVLEALESAKIDYEIKDNLVRGLDYYSNTVFELEADIDGFGSSNVVGGGGRYDELVSFLDGPKTPCVGMAFGLDRLIAICDNEGMFEGHKEHIHAYLITLGEKAKLKGQELLMKLRMGGILTDTDFLDKSLKAQFKQADNMNARFTLILGEDEIDKNVINVKDNLNEVQETVLLDNLYQYLLEKLTCNKDCSKCGR